MIAASEKYSPHTTMWVFLLSVFALMVFGCTEIYSTTYFSQGGGFLLRQIIWFAAGCFMAGVVTVLPPSWLNRSAKWLVIALIAALVYLALANFANKVSLAFFQTSITRFIPFTEIRNGACRWLGFGPITIQPSEFAKFIIIYFLSSYYGARDSRTIENLYHGVIIPGSVCGIIILLILFGRSLSNAILNGGLMLLGMYFACVRCKHIAALIGIALLLVSLIILFTPFRRQRILSYLLKHETQNAQMANQTSKINNYQVERSLCALGSGGFRGRGIGHGRLKHKSIPEAHTDFIFAVIGEEVGWIGIFCCIIVYFLVAYSAVRIGYHANSKQGTLACDMVACYLAIQALLNLSVICQLFPTTGVTAPLISYGGSSVMSTMLCIGLVLNVLLHTEELPSRRIDLSSPHDSAGTPLDFSRF